MKYLRKFENSNNDFYIVIYQDLSDPVNSLNVQLFNNIDSAENCYLETVNGIKHLERKNDKVISNLEEAETWMENYGSDYTARIKVVDCKNNYDISPELQREIDAKKFNI